MSISFRAISFHGNKIEVAGEEVHGYEVIVMAEEVFGER
jgi:hypothetical protein